MLGAPLVERGVDVIVSTNAVHLYPDLADTVASWLRALRPGGHVLINSGNIRNPRARRSEWILDETVWVVGDLAEGLVRTDPAYAAYVAELADTERMKAHAAYRDRVFLHPRPLEHYLETLGAGRPQGRVGPRGQHRGPRARTGTSCSPTYHDAVLGWVGRDREGRRGGALAGGRGRPPGADPPRHGRPVPRPPTFQACWTYVTCVFG